MTELHEITAEEIEVGDVLTSKPLTIVTGEVVVGPIPSFGVDRAVIVPISIEYPGAFGLVESVQAFRPGQTVTVER